MTTDQLPSILFGILLVLTVCEAITAGFGRDTTHRFFLAMRTWTALFGMLFVIFSRHRLPLYGAFEGSISICFYMGVLAHFFIRFHRPFAGFRICAALAALGVLAVQTGRPMNLNPDYYMYENGLVASFFHLRLLSCAVLVHAAGQYVSCGLARDHQSAPWRGGRNFLLAGTCFFLAGEWTGSLWALNWLGDPWQWSRGFFKAAILFLLVMAACHLPVPLSHNRFGRAAFGILPGIFSVWMVFFH